MPGATGVIFQHYQRLRLPRNCKVKIRWKSPSIASGPIEKRLGRDWSMILFGELTRPIFGNAVGWKSNLFALVLSPKFHQMLRLLRKVTLQLHQILRLSSQTTTHKHLFSFLLLSSLLYSTLLFSALHVSRH